jgi:hypothetical protein
MKRQYDYTVNWPMGGQPGGLAENWRDDHIFERWGDDNTVYFTSTPDQLILPFSGLSPYGPIDSSTTDSGTVAEWSKVQPGEMRTTFLCEETENVRRQLCLAPSAAVKVFIDAWESWQTTPITISTKGGGRYTWQFFNYVPITGPSSGTSSPGGASSAASTSSLAASTAEFTPVVKTLGHVNRSPLGEFPVSEATKAKSDCCCASHRPYVLIQNTNTTRLLWVIVEIGE